jgi:epoxyqueuosine reductase QueG
MISLNEKIEQFLLERGALNIGFAIRSTLEGGPSTVDIRYPLSDAESAICFALPLNKKKARSFLRKDLPDGRRGHEEDNILTNIRAYQIAVETAKYIKGLGFKAVAIFPNFKYREDVPGWEVNMIPELSLRLIAIRSGAVSLGFSGNVGLKGYGAMIILGCVVTSANLTPTNPIPQEESFCNECKLCQKVCALRMFGSDELDSITIGGYTFSCAKRVNLARCQIVCGGLSGLDKSKKWSTWSPGRYPFPESDKEVMRILATSINNALKWPERGDEIGIDVYKLKHHEEFLNALGDDKEKLVKMIKETKLTCGNCQLICWGDPKETAENYRILSNSGCVLQKENGEIIVLPYEDAERAFNEMNPKHRRLYYKEIGKKHK